MIKIEKIKITLLALLISVYVSAKENINYPGISNVKNERVAAGCTPSTSQTDLDVNNVRTTIMGGGDMWWNLDDARYEIPKYGNKHSMFAGLPESIFLQFVLSLISDFKITSISPDNLLLGTSAKIIA